MNKVLDSFSTLSKREVDENGFWRIDRNPIAREGVMAYSLGQLPVPIPAGKNPSDLVQVLKSPKGFQQGYLDSLKGKPIIIDHTWISGSDEDLNDSIVAGNIGDTVVFEDGVLYANIYINSSKAQELIGSGLEELSVGSTTRVIEESGEYNGEHYDYVMFHEVANHVAIVAEGRCGPNVKVLDKALKELNMSNRKKEKGLMDSLEVSEVETKEVNEVEDTLADVEAKLEGIEGKEEIISLIKGLIESATHVVPNEVTEDETKEEEKTEDEEAFTAAQMSAIEEIVRKMLSDVTDSEAFEEAIMDSVAITNSLKTQVESKYGLLPSSVQSKKQILEYVGTKAGIAPTMDSVHAYLKASSFGSVKQVAQRVQDTSSDAYRNKILKGNK